MRFTILTLFPEIFAPWLRSGMLGKALKQDRVSVKVFDFRRFADGLYRKVDDYPFGGGPGVILMAPPIIKSLEYVQERWGKATVVFMTPSGTTWNYEALESWRAQSHSVSHVVVLCGRYEGVDHRVLEYVDYEISIGDFVLCGGEIPAMAWIESIIRFVPGVLGNAESAPGDSFQQHLIKGPQYTKPRNYRGKQVPETLLSGNHRAIAEWHSAQSELRTKQRRPDLWDRYIHRNEGD